jgi:hypothetical protein
MFWQSNTIRSGKVRDAVCYRLSRSLASRCRKAGELGYSQKASEPSGERARRSHVRVSNEYRGVWHGSKWQSTSLGLLIVNCLPVVAAFGVLYRQRLSVPYHDDYEVILAFANRYGQLLTLARR